MKSKAKVLQKLLEDPNSEFVLLDFLDRMLSEKLQQNDENQPKPVGKTNYVGIEVECYGPLRDKEVMELLLAHDLESYVNVGDDGSIEPDHENIIAPQTYEFRILIKESELPIVFKRLSAFFKEGKFEANDSCGLHVHLDMRNRDVEKCYAKLLKFQEIMFPLVSRDRWINEYCDWSLAGDKHDRRMTAVNYTAYEEHRTIEIRLHHGTVDVKKISNWVRLLLKAIKSAPVKEIKSKAAAVKWAGKDKALKSYISKEFNPIWFKKKEEVIQGFDGQNDNYDGGDEDLW